MPGTACGVRSTRGPSWGYLKVNFSETLSSFGDKCPQNGSKNEETAPRTRTGYPHAGPGVGARAGCQGGAGRSHVDSLIIYELGFNQVTCSNFTNKDRSVW